MAKHCFYFKRRYSDLFSLAEDVEEVKVVHNKSRTGRKGGTNTKSGNKGKQAVVNNSESSEDSSDVSHLIKIKKYYFNQFIAYG